jgi:hypothetical protein
VRYCDAFHLTVCLWKALKFTSIAIVTFSFIC